MNYADLGNDGDGSFRGSLLDFISCVKVMTARDIADLCNHRLRIAK